MRHAQQPIKIGIVAGELSGDILGAGLMAAIKAQHPDAQFVGIGGPKMQALGCQSLFDMEELAVMGLVEVIERLPRLISIKRQLVAHFCASPPDIFVGIDAPDFNLRLEKTLKDKGMLTVHYVSPSVWAWRQNRVFSIAKATHLVLALLPFEKAFYDQFNVPCQFVGHTMADDIALVTDKTAARDLLGLDHSDQYLAVLPGSRAGEMALLAPIFIQTCLALRAQYPQLKFVVALVNPARKAQFEQAWQQYAPELDFVLVDDTARNVIAAADWVLLASGTVALECMLLKRPMVVGYKVNALTAWIARRMLKTEFVSLPNILAGREIVVEKLQEDCTVANLTAEVSKLMTGDNQAMLDVFEQLHLLLRCDADKTAANAVLNLIAAHSKQE